MYPSTRRGRRAGRNKRKNDYSKNTGPNRLIDLNSKVGPNISNNRKTHGIRLALINAQSVRNKTDMIVDHIIDNDIDVLCITESWLCESGDEKVIKDLTPDGYKFINVPRSKGCKEKHGGGIGILYRASYKLNTKTEFNASSFENCEITLDSSSSSSRIAIIYRRPPSKKHKIASGEFLDQFSEFLEKYADGTNSCMIIGDFNYHWNKPDDTNANRLRLLLASLNFAQHVTEPTHTSGHTLDLVITPRESTFLHSVCTSSFISDHAAIHCDLDIQKQPPASRIATFRRYNKINNILFREDLAACFLDTSSDLDGLIDQFTSSITDIINKHAPLTTRKIPIRQSFPWYSIDIKLAKRERRKAERKWNHTGLTIHRDIFKYHRRKVKELIAKAKAKYYQDAIIECSDSKSPFRVMDHLLKRKSEPKLPSFTSAKDLSNRFANYFSDKITNIRTVILKKQKQDDYDYEPPSVNTPNLISFDTFCPVTVEEICKTIMCCPTTSCVLDPLPTQLLKTIVDILSPVITRIVNLSLTTGKCPCSQKSAIITPLLKKASLDPESLKNYRPVSNLTFVSKLLERMVAKQLHDHLSQHQLYEKHQSAYRKRHSTETALTRVQNDILRAMDDSKATVLVLLDLSAAFDTVDHNFLLERLKQCGISGTLSLGSNLTWKIDLKRFTFVEAAQLRHH